MKLLTQKIKKALPALYSTDGVPAAERKVIVKFFNPTGHATWYAFEGEEQEDGDWLFFGWAELLPGCGEFGDFLLSELASHKGAFGLGIERDLHLGTPKFGETRDGKQYVEAPAEEKIPDADFHGDEPHLPPEGGFPGWPAQTPDPFAVAREDEDGLPVSTEDDPHAGCGYEHGGCYEEPAEEEPDWPPRGGLSPEQHDPYQKLKIRLERTVRVRAAIAEELFDFATAPDRIAELAAEDKKLSDEALEICLAIGEWQAATVKEIEEAKGRTAHLIRLEGGK